MRAEATRGLIIKIAQLANKTRAIKASHLLGRKFTRDTSKF
jgi:hypothetical protein